MPLYETIVALATPPLKSALGIIRVSGEKSFEIVSKCFSKNIATEKRDIFVGFIKDNEKRIDQVVLIAYKNPHSFTGEDSVEIICHGSLLIENQIIEVLLKNGAKLAEKGEFSSRAFLNKKLDLIQAESINDLINSTTTEAKDLSLLSLNGQTSALITPIKTKLADLISLIEVNIDFPEYEDIEVANINKIFNDVNIINHQIETLLKDGKKGQLIKDGIKVAIVGKPNVGKSSLLNALSGKEKAIVTNIAGTTRDIVENDININGLSLHLLDTAGIRETSDIIEQIGVNKTKEAIKEADLVLAVFDANDISEDEYNSLLSEIKNKEHIVVINKSDLNIEEKFKGIYVSAKNNDIGELNDAIFSKFGLEEKNFTNPSLNNTRQLGLLAQAKRHLDCVLEDAKEGKTIDILSISLMAAYTSILEILGEANQIDLAKEIFSRFCVGK